MSGYGELFVDEYLRDWLKDNRPEFKFASIEHDLYECWSVTVMPDTFIVTLLDEENKPIVDLKVFVNFYIEDTGGGKYIEAEVENVKIKKERKKNAIQTVTRRNEKT